MAKQHLCIFYLDSLESTHEQWGLEPNKDHVKHE